MVFVLQIFLAFASVTLIVSMVSATLTPRAPNFQYFERYDSYTCIYSCINYIFIVVSGNTLSSIRAQRVAPNTNHLRVAIRDANICQFFQAQVQVPVLRWTRARSTFVRLRRSGPVPVQVLLAFGGHPLITTTTTTTTATSPSSSSSRLRNHHRTALAPWWRSFRFSRRSDVSR